MADPPFNPQRDGSGANGTKVWGDLRTNLPLYEDNFDRLVVNELTDLVNIPGEKDFTPERLRFFKDGTRRFLQYGTDSTHTETDTGRKLEPGSGQTLTLKSTERLTYPVGIDLWPSASYRLLAEPQSGDAAGWGYGKIDLANFDPESEEWSGTDADGYFAIYTESTGTGNVLLIGARNGTVFNKTTVSKQKAADTLSIIEARLNWYDVGPAVFRESFTDVANDSFDPQQNPILGAIANDDGKGAALGSQRPQFAIHQASGNSGFGLEAGSIAVKASSMPNFQFKTKSHTMTLEYQNPTGEFQVLGAIRGDNDRPTIHLRFPEIEISETPGSGTNRTKVVFVAVHPDEADADTKTFSTPPEHSSANSVVEHVEDNTITGPDEDGSNTDVSGPDTTNDMDNPGGYQLAADVVGSDSGSGGVFDASQSGRREVADTDIALVLGSGSTSGTIKLEVQTEQNS
jgi:hypothetical protein